MKVVTLAGLFGVALVAVLVNSPVEGSPLPDPEPEPEADPKYLGTAYEGDGYGGTNSAKGKSLNAAYEGEGKEHGGGKSLGAAYEGYGSGHKSGGGGGGGGSGGGGGGGGGDGALLDLEVLLNIDLSGLGDLLNALLRLLLGVATAKPCEYKDYAVKFEGLLVDLHVYLNLLGIEVQVNLLIILGPLLEAVLKLVEGLLAGLLIDLAIILNLVLNILVTLNLQIDLEVAAQLGNLLNLDVLALLQLG